MNRLPRRQSKPGPVIEYLLSLFEQEQRVPGKGFGQIAERALSSVRAALQTEDGAMLLELLEKSTQDYNLPPTADERALDALNAQCFIARDLRRILTDEFDQVLAQHTAQQSGTGRRRR